MTKKVSKYRYTFITPDNFELDKESSYEAQEVPESMTSVHGAQPSLSLTFVHIDNLLDAPQNRSSEDLDFSEKLNLESFLPTISLLTLPAQFNSDPLVYLERGNSELEKSIATFKSEFCRKTMVGNHIAAYSQGAIHSIFTVYRLVFAWVIEGDLMTAEITAIEDKIEQNWIELNNFVNSVQPSPT